MNYIAKKNIMNVIAVLCLLSLTLLISCEKEKDTPEPEKDVQVFISYPPYNHHFSEDELPLTLKGSAMAFNGDFSDKIKWTSDKDGDLGIGKKITVSLSRGVHTITAYADNGHIPGSYDIPVTIYAAMKKEKPAPQKDYIVRVNDRDGAVFIVNRSKQVITDTSTGLMWDRNPDATRYTYDQAVRYARNAKLGGYTDWRLPTLQEAIDIHNIYHDGREAILQDEFVSFPGSFWTKTTVDQKSGAHKYVIKQVDVTGGARDDLLSEKSYADVRAKLHVRLVRSTR